MFIYNRSGIDSFINIMEGNAIFGFTIDDGENGWIASSVFFSICQMEIYGTFRCQVKDMGFQDSVIIDNKNKFRRDPFDDRLKFIGIRIIG